MKHAPVDPKLELAIVIPDAWLGAGDWKRLGAEPVDVTRTLGFATKEGWAAEVRAHNESYVVGEPVVDGAAWRVAMTSTDKHFGNLVTWHREISAGLGVDCTAIVTLRERTADDDALAKATCDGIQRVDGGLFVPFKQPAGYHELMYTAKKRNYYVKLDHYDAIAADKREPAKGATVVDRGGGWWLSSEKTIIGSTSFVIFAREHVGALDLACHGDVYDDRAHAEQQHAVCDALVGI